MENSFLKHYRSFFFFFLFLANFFDQTHQKHHYQQQETTTTTTLPSNHTLQEAYNVLGVSPNPDGSMSREIRIPTVNATPSIDPSMATPIALSKDVATAKLWLRIFRPLEVPSGSKLPLIIYFHGGDFVLFSAATIIFHNFCNDIASQIPAIVVSVDHRLAPEYRLPAAFDDALTAIQWIRQQALNQTKNREPWLESYADFSKVFLLGSASGGNIAYRAALQSLQQGDLQPLQIRGLIMNQPYFGGVERTPSELRMMEDAFVPLYVNDVLWSLALPEDADRDSEFANPLVMGCGWGKAKRFPATLVKGNSGDPLVDRGRMLARKLGKCGVDVTSVVVEGGFHGVELNNATAAQELYDLIKGFVDSSL